MTGLSLRPSPCHTVRLTTQPWSSHANHPWSSGLPMLQGFRPQTRLPKHSTAEHLAGCNLVPQLLLIIISSGCLRPSQGRVTRTVRLTVPEANANVCAVVGHDSRALSHPSRVNSHGDAAWCQSEATGSFRLVRTTVEAISEWYETARIF